jgi:hypothetical protein
MWLRLSDFIREPLYFGELFKDCAVSAQQTVHLVSGAQLKP